MTAEVAVLNKSAIALAADSAVTLGGDQGKIYNTVNKLFTLNKRFPVGIMIYANADFMGIPFETIIKIYRDLTRKSEKTIEDYAKKFTVFLSSAKFASQSQQETNVFRIWQTVFESILDDIRKAMEMEFRQHGACEPKRQKEIIAEVFSTHLEELKKSKAAPGFEKTDPSALLKQYQQAFASVKKSTLAGLATSKPTDACIAEIAGLILTKEHPFSTYSGIVIAGFGEEEIFPQYVELTTEGVIADIHKIRKVDSDGIKHHESHSMIVPFAQRDMVGRFMEGVDLKYRSYIDGAMERAIKDCANGVIDAYVAGNEEEKKKVREQVNTSIEKQLLELQEKSRKYRQKKFIDPILEVVVGLPKEELANLAEALVNLTSIKRRVSTERETVGGPIDVAVISKGDGFIWIRRKHYFKLELNPHFIPGYMEQKEATDAKT